MKRTLASSLLLLTTLFGIRSHAYILPNYRIDDADAGRPAEEVLAKYESRMEAIADSVNASKLERYERNTKIRLTPNERRFLGEYLDLKIPIRFWRYVVDLKKSLIELKRGDAEAAFIQEADEMAKIIIDEIYRISQEYRVAFTALFQNFLVNSGVRKKGHCYHYVWDLIDALSKRGWNHFELRWGCAYDKTFRENNALVITAKGARFEEGLAVDSWRTAGKPFWIRVKDDRFPWTESPGMIDMHSESRASP